MNTIKRFSLFTFLMLCFSMANSQEMQDKQLDSIIRVCVNKIDKVETIENMKWSASMMERVTKMKDNWSSNYYLSYFNLLVAMETKIADQKEVYYNSFLKSFEKSESFAKSNREKSELLTLKAFLKIDILVADPIKNGKDLSGEILLLFDEAIKLYPKNPRAIYLNGVFKSGLASFFKKNENYCDSFLIANKIFIKDFIDNVDYLLPLWGAEHNAALLLKCYDKK
jgi:hypothetical protein